MSKRSAPMLSTRDHLKEALLKAKSLSLITYGEAGDAFRALKGEDQDVILWVLSDLVYEAFDAAERICKEG